MTFTKGMIPSKTDKKKYYVPLEHYYELVNYRKEVDTLRLRTRYLNPWENISIHQRKITVPPLAMWIMFYFLRPSAILISKRTYNEDIFIAIR